jgi:hypothetical protein
MTDHVVSTKASEAVEKVQKTLITLKLIVITSFY